MIDVYIATLILLGIVVLVAGAFWLYQARTPKLPKPRIYWRADWGLWVCDGKTGTTPSQAYRLWRGYWVRDHG